MPIETGNFKDINSFFENDYKTNLLSAITECSEELIYGKGWPDGVNNLLQNLGKLTGVSRVWIFQTMKLTETEIIQDYTFEWASKPEYVQIGISRFSMFTNQIDTIEYKNLIESRKKGEWQKVLHSKLEPSFFKDDIEKQGIKSMLTTPILINNEWWGTLGFDDCERENNWTSAEIAILRISSALIASAVLRNKLLAKREQFATLQSITDSSLWSVDLKTWHVRYTTNLSDTSFEQKGNHYYPMRNILKRIHPEDRKQLILELRKFNTTKNNLRKDIRFKFDNLNYKWIEIIGRMNFDSSDTPAQFTGIAIDIIDRKKEEEKLREEASIDPLTGIMNRRIFNLQFDKLIHSSISTKESISLIILDIDHFKEINDQYGHNIGDKVLIHMVNTINKMLRENDIFARFGGDEFVIILPHIGKRQTELIGNRIRKAIQKSSCKYNDKIINFTISLGSTTYKGKNKMTINQILSIADEALYTAKRNGRNKFHQI